MALVVRMQWCQLVLRKGLGERQEIRTREKEADTRRKQTDQERN